MNLRPYQAAAIDSLWHWFMRHETGNPIMDCCVGSGKSLMIAATIQRALREYPDTRVIVIAHQKELIEQNLAKLLTIWPDADVGVYSAALGRKELGRRITYATIGSIYRDAHLMGAVHLVLCDEAHMISTRETGMWRKFIADLARYGNAGVRVIGWTGTPFRNGGVWITAGDDPLFHGIAAKVSMQQMLAEGYLAPLVSVQTVARIDTSDARVVAGDWNVSDLAKAADKRELVEAACTEIVALANGRRRMLVFAVNVEHATHVCEALVRRGVVAAVVTGETPAAQRAEMLSDYARGAIRCMVSVGVLTTGFDQPDIDFIALLRPTKSPTLAIQMCGRGMRTAPGKADCAFADFTTTIAELGPIDAITGRMPSKRAGPSEAPFRICPACGSRNTTAAAACIDCGHDFPPQDRVKHGAVASDAPILAHQLAQKVRAYPVTEVRYGRHQKSGAPDSMRVDYYSGLRRVCSEWVCLSHPGFAGAKAAQWWARRAPREFAPGSTDQALEWIATGYTLAEPAVVHVNESGKWPEIIKFDWRSDEQDGTDADAQGVAIEA